jgi:hypothetical protein
VLLVAYLLLGIGVFVGNGTLPGLPFALAAATLVLLALPMRDRRSRLRAPLLPWCIAASAGLVVSRAPAADTLLLFLVPLTLILGCLGVAVCVRPPLARGSTLAIALGLYALAGGLLIARAPPPRIDVLEFQQDGARDLVAGRDPYASSFPNVYTPEETRRFFGDERTELHGFPYPPLSLLATTLGRVVGGDVRWTLLAAQLGIGLLLFALARGAGHGAPVAVAITTLHLLHPRGLFVLEQGWTDAMVACAFLSVLLVLQRGQARWLGLALGLFFASKQYSVILFPILLRVRRVSIRAWLEALFVTAVVTLPFVAWSPRDFIRSVVLWQLQQPFRPDALSIPAFVAWATGWRAPGALAVAGAAAGLASCWRSLRAPAPLSALPLGAALIGMGFFLFAKQAFCNYYYFVGVLILASEALLDPADVAAA